MRRGTRVGQAYVAITADGSGINDDIADSFDDVDFKGIGKDHGAKYREGLRKHLKHLDSEFGNLLAGKGVDRYGNKVSSKLAKAIEADKTIDKSVNKMLNKAFKRGDLDDLMNHVGRKAGVDFGDGFDKVVKAEVRASLTNALRDAARQGEGLNLNAILYGKKGKGGGKGEEMQLLGAAMKNAVRNVKAANKKMEADLARSLAVQERMEKQSRKANLKFSEQFFKARSGLVKKSLANDERLREAAAKSEARLREQQQKLFDKLAKENADNERKGYEDRTKFVEKFLRAREGMLTKSIANEARLQEAADRATAKAQEKLLRVQQRAHFNRLRDEHREEQKRLRVSGNRDDGRGIADMIGRMTGKGSRNNFLNIFGRTMGGIVGLVEKAGRFATGFASGMGKAADNASMLQRVMAGFKGGSAASGLTGMLTKMAAAWPAVLIGLGAILLASSALASVIGGLVGIMVALASTIASALVGALLVLGPLIGATIVGVGLLTAAFTSMTNAQREHMSGAFKGFKEDLTGLGQIIMTEFTRPLYNGQSAIQVWSANLSRALIPLSGVAESTAGAFARAGNIITASLSGPGFQRFFTVLGQELPGIVINLSRALGDTMNGIGSMFAALLPYVTQFTEYLADAAERFADWAESAEGQNSIKDFAERAIESVKALWGFLKEFGGFIKDLLFSEDAQDAGNTIFGQMEDAFKRFRRAIKDGRLEQWFEDAIEFAKDLGAVMGDLWDAFTDLYDSGVLQATGDAFKAIAGFIEGVTSAAEPLLPLFKVLLPFALGVALGPIWLVAEAINAIAAAADLAAGKIDALSAKWSVGIRAGLDAGLGIKLPRSNSGGDDSPAPIQGPPRMQGPIKPRLDPRMVKRMNSRATAEELRDSGNKALWGTDKEYGGYLDPKDDKSGSGGTPNPMPNPQPGKSGAGAAAAKKLKVGFMRDYTEYVKGLMAYVPTLAQEIRAAAREANKELQAAMADASKMLSESMSGVSTSLTTGIIDASKSTDYKAIFDSFESLLTDARDAGVNAQIDAYDNGQAAIADAMAARDSMVSDAQSAVESAANDLLSASTPKEQKAALKALKKAERALMLARKRGEALIAEAHHKADALIRDSNAARDRIESAMKVMAEQGILNEANVISLVSGLGAQNATLADLAEARRIVGERLAEATQGLVNAISIRDNYKTQIADATRSFASILSIQARTINGVTQALTAGDISSGLRDRLAQIRKYHTDLRLLLAQGLSDDAYKQLVDAGVEGGGAYVDAILSGGQGAVSELNDLLSQIDTEAVSLGNAASSRLYQAGVDTAQGLVDGLTQLDAQLTSAAEALGRQIAEAIKRILAEGGDGQLFGIGSGYSGNVAPMSTMSTLAPSAEVANYTAQQRMAGAGVSGNTNNDPRFLWTGNIVTPTEDPEAVANEVLNEITGRL